MKPNKRELLDAISWLSNWTRPCFVKDVNLFDKNIIMVEDFINDNFELIEKMTWLKNSLNENNGLFDFIFKNEDEVKSWLDIMKLHVIKCEELGRELHKLKRNPPLKFEELEDGEWYWCEPYGWCLMNFYEDTDGKTNYKADAMCHGSIDVTIEENRFYRKQVDEDE